MGTELEGKVALVTGSSRGIGRAIADRLGGEGAVVVVHYNTSRSGADATVKAIEEAGGRAVAVQGDVAQAQAVRSLYDAAEEAFGGIDIVVNNAAIVAAGPVEEIDEETFDRLVAVNLKAVFVSAQEAAKRVRNGGRVINMSTTLPAAHVANLGAYGATKGGIDVLTRALARHLGPRGTTVNAVAPGPTDTDMLVPEARAQVEAHLEDVPLRRVGLPADIADAVAFLAGPRGGWITGHTLPANGGLE
jgi:3-oxoacyl-[acyl-carrier protein] reductase